MKREFKNKKPLRKRQKERRRFIRNLFVFVIIAVISVFSFLHRQEINNWVEKNIPLVKEKIDVVKKKPQNGYKKEDRVKLEALVHKEAKND